ncbi:MAG: sensor histidine kinase [Nibricoccus sp.]
MSPHFLREFLSDRTLNRLIRRLIEVLKIPLILVSILVCLASTANAASDESKEPRGLPFIRTYPLDEIGNVPRGLRLGLDAFGRIAVMYDGVYSVLNDSSWVSQIDSNSNSRDLMTTIRFADGKYYYGGRGSWGTIEITPDGKFRNSSLVPTDAPAWTRVTPFNKLFPTKDGMFFYELNGVVYRDFLDAKNRFFALPRVSAAFPVGNRVFVSCQDTSLRELLVSSESSKMVTGSGLDGMVVEYAAVLDETRTLLALKDGTLMTFDGETATPWVPQSTYQVAGKITAMERLHEGGIALAVAGKGVYIFSPKGTLMWSLMLPEFRRVGSIASGETGVLWVAGESAVHRIFYDSPLTSFGQQLGLSVVWPHIAKKGDRVFVCSNGSLYEAKQSAVGHPPTFQALSSKSALQSDYIAASGTHLLMGNPSGVFSVSDHGEFTPLITIDNVAGLRFIDSETCIAIGSREIAVLRHVEGKWVECASRIPGVGDSPIHIEEHRGLWIELGGDQVAHLSLNNGKLEMKRIRLSWPGTQWTNIGIIENIIIFSGPTGQREYYDENTQSFCQAPEIDKLLKQSPYWLLRIKKDLTGALWASHSQGIVTLTPRDGSYEIDSTTFELRNDAYPTVTLLPDNQIWIGAGRSLYHVERTVSVHHELARIMPVSLKADRRNIELLDHSRQDSKALKLSFDDNSLSFRFFSGTYAWRSPPQYEYRLGSSEPWSPVDPSLSLRFPKLQDGSYLLEVRQVRPRVSGSAPFAFAFVIEPPWYKTATSYTAYFCALLLLIGGIARWINHRSLEKNAILEHLVQKRTKELEVTMGKLAEESRNAATHAERSRLAGEIHDSVQQGLSGTILHLDSTIRDADVTPQLHAKLSMMRSMLSYSREEVQQAVWNLESPLLQNSNLGDALRKLAGYISPGSVDISVTLQEVADFIPPDIQHNLLRIAQEAITNAVKHADASQIEVSLEQDAKFLTLTVADNGKGFDPAARATVEGHFGLRGLRSRAKSMKAELTISSALGTGTIVKVSVPIEETSSSEPIDPTGAS